MFIIDTPVKLYGKSVVTDLITRTGRPQPDSSSPIVGMHYLIDKFWSDNLESEASLELLFGMQKDYDADIGQPRFSNEDYDSSEAEVYKGDMVEQYSPSKHPTSFDKYNRRLEDIADEYLTSYIGNLIYSVKNQDGGNKDFLAKHRVQATLTSMDDDDDFTELSDLQLDVNVKEWSVEVKSNARLQLPYVMKRLFNLSCYCHIHMLSYIVAYLKAKAKNDAARNAGSTKTLKSNAVIQQGVYLCNSLGQVIKKVTVESKNVHAAEMFDWINGTSNKWEAYYKDYVQFIHYCDVLNIDLINDDMLRYDRDFIYNLQVLTVTPNEQYNKQVFEALKNHDTGVKEVKKTVTEIPLDNTMEILQQACVANSRLADYIAKLDDKVIEKAKVDAMSLHYLYVLKCCNSGGTSPELYSWRDGLLYYDDELVLLYANYLEQPGSTNIFDEPYCVISSLGFVVHLSKWDVLDIMMLDSAIDNLKKIYFDNCSDYQYASWRRFVI